jgi:RecA/RadA recombinase
VFFGSDDWFSCDFLPSGIAGVDWIIGQGIAYGRLGELFGGYSSGKTYLLYLFLAMNQRQGGTSVLIETEYAYDEQFFRSLGGDPESLILIPAPTTQFVFNSIANICKHVIKEKTQEKVAVGWDGIAATNTKHLKDTGMDKADMSKPRAMSQGTSYITHLVSEAGIAVIATNQTRERIDDKSYDPMKRTHTPGGRAWPFHGSQRSELVFRGGYIRGVNRDAKGKKKDPDANTPNIGHWVEVYVDKNKLAPPHLKCRLPFYSYDDEEHPVWGTLTRMGVDYAEALWDFYLNSRFRLDPANTKRPVVRAVTANGWYAVDESIAPGAPKFQAKDWPGVLESYPELWQVVYRQQPPQNEESDAGAATAKSTD